MKHLRMAGRALPVPVHAALAALGLGLGLVALVVMGAVAVAAGENPATAHGLLSSSQNLLLLGELTPKAIAAGLLGAMGVPVHWHGTFVVSGSGTMAILSGGTIATLALTVPAVASIMLGRIVGRRSERRVMAHLVAASGVFAAGAALLAMAATGTVAADAFLGVSFAVAPLFAAAVALAWALVGGTLGVLLTSHRVRLRGRGVNRPAYGLTMPALGLVAVVLLGASISAAGRPTRHGRLASPTSALGVRGPIARQSNRAKILKPDIPAARKQLVAHTLRQLRSDRAEGVETTESPQSGTPDFVHLRLPVNDGIAKDTGKARNLAARYGGMFGISELTSQLRPAERTTDSLGMTKVAFEQVYKGHPVYGGSLSLEFDKPARTLTAMSNSLIPDVQLPGGDAAKTTPEQAVTAARKALGGAKLIGTPKLVVFAGEGQVTDGKNAKLVWLVRLADDNNAASNLYAIDAQTGTLDAVLERGESARTRLVYSAWGTRNLPGWFVRGEGQGPTGDREIDGAYNGTGATYDYYRSKFARDSYDNAGAALVSTVHYGTGYQNAFWDGSQMAYGDGFAAALDVTGHELTHAVTERTSGLQYSGESGALNEAMSDIFGEMVERNVRGQADWLIGEELPIGAIRSMANPASYGQPADMAHYVVTCRDNGGVHTNSGIINKAFYNLAQAVGPDAAERIFYRAGTTYFTSGTTLEGARAGALQATSDLYSDGGAHLQATRNAFDAVGLDGGYYPPHVRCLCGVRVGLSGQGLQGLDSNGPTAGTVMDTLYKVRDQIMPSNIAGQHYGAVWSDDSDRVSELMLSNDTLRADAAQLMQNMQPGLNALTAGDGSQVTMTPQLVDEMQGFLSQLKQADQDNGGSQLAQGITEEEQTVNLDSLKDLTFDQVLTQLNNRVG